MIERNNYLNKIKSYLGKPIIKVLVHSLAFGTLLPFIPKEGEKPMSQKQIEMTLDVMANSLVYWTQDIVHNNLLMEKARIFAMTSSGGHTVLPYYGAVSAAKSALESYVRQLALELGHLKVSINAIMAGVTDTPALRKIPGNLVFLDVARRRNPHQELTNPKKVAEVVIALTQEGGYWINGSIIHADGGEDVVSFVGQGTKGEGLDY